MSGSLQSQTSDSTSRSLLRRAREHDAEAWHKLTAVYSPSVYSWCRRCGLQNSDAADITQEVFRAVASALADFRKEKPSDTFRGWLWTITRNKIRDHFRDLANRPDAPGGTAVQLLLHQLAEEIPHNSTDAGDKKLQRTLARRAVALMQGDFQESTWQAFWRTTVDSQAPKSVAADLGLSVSAVYMAKSRVLRRLREELDGLDLMD